MTLYIVFLIVDPRLDWHIQNSGSWKTTQYPLSKAREDDPVSEQTRSRQLAPERDWWLWAGHGRCHRAGEECSHDCLDSQIIDLLGIYQIISLVYWKMFGMHACIIRRPVLPGICLKSLRTLKMKLGIVHSFYNPMGVLLTTMCRCLAWV
jgi:hypothetical protein